MKTDWIIIGIVVLFAVVLIILLVKRNLKDKKEIEKFLNEDHKANPKEEAEMNDDR